MEGVFRLGTKFSGRAIAQSLGVSQMPVREALKRLEGDGAIEGSAKSSFIVPTLSAAQYRELVAIRVELEGLVCRHAAARISEPTLRRVKSIYANLLAARTWPDVLRHNFELHFLVYASAEMPYALSMIESLWLRVGPALNEIGVVGNVSTSAGRYPELLAALEAREGDRAERVLASDILDNAEVLLGVLQSRSSEAAS